jgi:hypothetical protein
MISLLDGHNEISAIPLEVKFYDLFYKVLGGKASFADTNRFFLTSSKLKFIDPDHKKKVDHMNAGHIDFSGIDHSLMKESLDNRCRKKDREAIGRSVIADYIVMVAEAFAEAGHLPTPKGFAVKEGNHGLIHIRRIRADFKDARFIVIARDPRDMFAANKRIFGLLKKGKEYNSFRGDVCLMRYLFDIYARGKTAYAYMRYFKKPDENKDTLHIKYEDLVSDTESEMKRSADFLGVIFAESMLKPTTGGRIWAGNASSEERFKGVVSRRIGKWKKELTEQEVKLIEFFLRPYMARHGYKPEYEAISKSDCVKALRLKHFGLPYLRKKDALSIVKAVCGYLLRVSIWFAVFFSIILFKPNPTAKSRLRHKRPS